MSGWWRTGDSAEVSAKPSRLLSAEGGRSEHRDVRVSRSFERSSSESSADMMQKTMTTMRANIRMRDAWQLMFGKWEGVGDIWHSALAAATPEGAPRVRIGGSSEWDTSYTSTDKFHGQSEASPQIDLTCVKINGFDWFSPRNFVYSLQGYLNVNQWKAPESFV